MLIPVFFAACERSDDDYTVMKYYGNAGEDIGYSIAISNDGYFICGQQTEIVKIKNEIKYWKRMAIIKAGFDGNVKWKYNFGDSTATSSGSKIIILEDGSVICAGYTVKDESTTEKDIFVVTANSEGTDFDTIMFESDGNQVSSDIIRTEEGFLILGTTDVKNLQGTDATGNIEGKQDILLMRIYDNLEQITTPIAIGYPGDDIGASLKPDIGGGYIVAGTTDMSGTGQGGTNIFLVRINADCNTIHPAILGGPDDESAADIEVLNDGYLISGTKSIEAGLNSAYITKVPLNISEEPLFARTIPKTTSWSVNAMSRYKNNYFVLTGQEGSTTSSMMLFFVIDQEGNLVEGKEKIIGGTGVQIAYDVVSDSDGNIIGIGKNSYETNSMITFVKFRF